MCHYYICSSFLSNDHVIFSCHHEEKALYSIILIKMDDKVKNNNEQERY